MNAHITIDAVDEHEYFVRVERDGESARVQFPLDPQSLADLGLAGVGDRRIIEYTMDYLARRQPVGDLPRLMFIDDVAASYADFPAAVRRDLVDPAGPGRS